MVMKLLLMLVLVKRIVSGLVGLVVIVRVISPISFIFGADLLLLLLLLLLWACC